MQILFQKLLLIFCFIHWLSQNFVSSNEIALQNAVANSTDIGGMVNAYYGNDLGRQPGETVRNKRVVITGTTAVVIWSFFFTPLATMTVSKNLDLMQIFKRCQNRSKAHKERDPEHPYAALWRSILCKETEAEAKAKKLLLEIVAIALRNLSPEATTLLQMEYAVFEQKMQKLRADKDQIEHLRWNTPSLKGKMFLCYLQEFVIFDEEISPDKHPWARHFDNDAVKADQFWRRCETLMAKRHAISSKGKWELKMFRWFQNIGKKVSCAAKKLGIQAGFEAIYNSMTNWGNNKDEANPSLENKAENNGKQKTVMKNVKASEAADDECSMIEKEGEEGVFMKLKKMVQQDGGRIVLARDLANQNIDEKPSKNDAGMENIWPRDYDLFDEFGPENKKDLREFYYDMRAQFIITRENPEAIFSKFIQVNASAITVNWAMAKENKNLHYPKVLRMLIDKTLEEAQHSLEYFSMDKIAEKQKKQFAMLEIRTVMANFFVEMRNQVELREIIFPAPIKRNVGEYLKPWDNLEKSYASDIAKKIFKKENEIDRDLLVAGNDLFMDAFQQLFQIQDKNREFYKEIILEVLLTRKETENLQTPIENNVQAASSQKRDKRAIGAVTTLLFGMGMQQGYRHFNLIQLLRDCSIRTINYKSFRCYPPPIIQEEIKFIQRAKEIAFQEMSRKTGATEAYKAWKPELTEEEKEIFEFNRKRRLEMPIKGKLIAEQLRNMAVMWKYLNEEKLKMEGAKKIDTQKMHSDSENDDSLNKEMVMELEFKKLREWIPNPGQTIAPIIKPGMLIEVALNFFTDNEKLDSLELLHVPLKKLKTLFPKQDTEISVPINFLVERYKPSVLSVPFNFIQEWAEPNSNVEILFNRAFVEKMRAMQITAIPLPVLWISTYFTNENDSIHVSKKQFKMDYQKMVSSGKLPENYPILLELASDVKSVHRCNDGNPVVINGIQDLRLLKNCLPESRSQTPAGGPLFKATAEPEKMLPNWLNLDFLESLEYKNLAVDRIRARLDEKLNAFKTPTMPRNIWVTLDWMESKLKELEAKKANDFIMPIVRQFFDNIFASNKKVEKEKVAKRVKRFNSLNMRKMEENAQSATLPVENVENYGQNSLVVSVKYLGVIMKSAQKIPTPSQFLTEADVQIPWKYSTYMDCTADYKYDDKDTLNRCKIYAEIGKQKELQQRRKTLRMQTKLLKQGNGRKITL